MKLTDTQIRGIKATGSKQKLFDGGGLFLLVTETGSKLWRLKYRVAGKERLDALGKYPQISLKEARARREEIKLILDRGLDPSAERQKEKIRAAIDGTTFEMLAREWHGKKMPKVKELTAQRILRRLEMNVFPYIGRRPVSAITAPELLEVFQHMEKRGIAETARRVLQTCCDIWKYAVLTERAPQNIASNLKGVLTVVPVTHRASITDAKQVGALLRAIDAYQGHFSTQCALRLAPLVFVRPGELQHAEWSEIDFDKAEWVIPAEKMKMGTKHIVPLSRQALKILHDLRPVTGVGRYVFPHISKKERPMSPNTILSALRGMGYAKEEMSGHGFRSTASTLLNEQGYNRDWIERQLAHSERDGVRAAYNYAEYLPERRRMMQEWADFLAGLRADVAVVA